MNSLGAAWPIWINPIVVATDPTNKNVESNDQVFPCKQLLFISSYVRTVKLITEIDVPMSTILMC